MRKPINFSELTTGMKITALAAVVLIGSALTIVHDPTPRTSANPIPMQGVPPTPAASSTIVDHHLPTVSGSINPAVTQANIDQTICIKGWASTQRPDTKATNKIKAEFLSKVDDKVATHYELDHVISIELGGALLDRNNLWLEPYTNPGGAREKDVVETYLKNQVCARKTTLKQAQYDIVHNWYQIYLMLKGRPQDSASNSDN